MCLDVPYPPDYGGVFDLFYKIKHLHAAGIRIYLHCFEYGRGRQVALEAYCEQVHYYERNRSFINFFLRLPYIVSSRKNKKLLHNLNQQDAPVLLEGIHCTYYLSSGKLTAKDVLVRLHNVEYEYYERLAISAHTFFKKLFFIAESRKLKRYEKQLSAKARFLAVSVRDERVYKDVLQARHIEYLPVFLPFDKITSLPGKGDYCLYHGNLSVPENEKAVKWLLEHVFPINNMQVVIAGKNPSAGLKKLIGKNSFAKMMANPSYEDMNELIQNAHIHLLPSFNSTGIKIKLLHALFQGRFVITNDTALGGTGLEALCRMAFDTIEFRNAIVEISEQSFTQNDIDKRSVVLHDQFNNEVNAQRLLSFFEQNQNL